MPDWLKVVLPYVLPTLITATTATLTAAPLRVRRLRNALVQDTAILQGSRRASKSLLTQEVSQRTVVLATYYRHPQLLNRDYLRLIVILALDASILISAYGLKVNPPTQFYAEDFDTAIVLLLAGFIWLRFHQGWVRRSHDRRRMLRAHGYTQSEDALANLSDLKVVSLFLGWLVTFGVGFVYLHFYLLGFFTFDQIVPLEIPASALSFTAWLGVGVILWAVPKKPAPK